jgi:hypothetical protein
MICRADVALEVHLADVEPVSTMIPKHDCRHRGVGVGWVGLL